MLLPFGKAWRIAAISILTVTGAAWPAPIPCETADANLPYQADAIGVLAASSCHLYEDRNGNHQMTADGIGMAGTQDALVFGSVKASGDRIIVAKIESIYNGIAGSKAGVMIRAGLAANSRNACMALTRSNGLVFQTRAGDGQSTTIATYAGVTYPYWVKLEKRGNTLKGYRSLDGVTWTQLGSATTINFGNDFHIGVASASHSPGTYAYSVLSGVSITSAGSGGFLSKAIGNPGIVGTLAESGGTYTLQASGADVYDTSDQFQFAYRQTSGDRAIIARVASLGNTNPWAKAGVMIRTNLEKYSENAFMAITYSNGADFQYRDLSGMPTTTSVQGGYAAPYWVKLEKRGNKVRGYRSSDGAAWTQVGGAMTLPITATYYLGLAYTSHNNATLGTATFTNVQVTALAPDLFESQNVGGPSLPGSYSASGGTHTLVASGADIWGTSDQFRFAFQKRKGDQTLIAKVNSISNTNAWAKAGIMIRTSLAGNSRNAFLALTPTAANGVVFQQRTYEGGTTSYQQAANFAVPYWLKLEKRSSTIKAFRSSDGINWTQVGGTANINLGNECYFGLASTSHTNSATGTSTFSNVLLVPGPSLSVLPISELGWDETLNPFAMDQTEVTEEEFISTMVNRWGSNARGGRAGSLKPITNITWADAILYANARSVRDGFKPVYTFIDFNELPDSQNPCASGFPGNGCVLGSNTSVDLESGLGYRLPIDEEWDFAYRLAVNGPFNPNASPYVWGLTEASETNSTAISRHAVWNTTASAVVGSKVPSQEGLTLFDMAGNAGEWTFEKNVRGGSWASTSAGQMAVSAKVAQTSPSYRSNTTGLRLILPTIRKNAKYLSKQERERFLNAIFTVKQQRFPEYSSAVSQANRLSWWDWFAMAHQATMMTEYWDSEMGMWEMIWLWDPPSLAHNTPAFLVWHREYINQMERALQTVDPRITIPFAMWGYGAQSGAYQAEADASLADVFSPYQSSSGNGLLGFANSANDHDFGGYFDPGYPTYNPNNLPLWWPLSENGPAAWTMPSYISWEDGRDFSLGFNMLTRSGNFPISVEMDSKLSWTEYNDFRQAIEGSPHADFHNTIGGHMESMFSPNDPLFYLHHSEVDRFWSLWQEMDLSHKDPGQQGYMPERSNIGERMQDFVWPFSGNFWRPNNNEIEEFVISWPTNSFPALPRTVTLSEVVKRKHIQYSVY